MMPSVDRGKRWRAREQRWVAPGALFDPRRYSVDVIDGYRVARPFVVGHHYAGSYVAERLPVGLFGPGARLVGVAVFSEPAGPNVRARYGGPLAGATAELWRLVLLPEIPYNAETWFVARAFRMLAREKGIRVVLSYADPVAWRVGDAVVKPEHWGTIYQASNALFVGRSWRRTHLVGPTGRRISPRALSKVRQEDRGWRYAAEQLVALGAPRRAVGESLAAWVSRVEQSAGFRRERHPGNLAYVFGLDAAARAALGELHAGGLPYPKRGAHAA